MRRVEEFLKCTASALVTKDRNNLRFYVAMHAVAALSAESIVNSNVVAKLDVAKLNQAQIEASLAVVKSKYDELGGDDHVAKGTNLLDAVRKSLESNASLTLQSFP